MLMKKTQNQLQRGIDNDLHAGAQLYVSLGGEVVADLAMGEARPGTKMTTESLTLWMSAGKPLAAIAILQLIEKGFAELDAPVARFIPEFATNGKAAITIRQLLVHTGGFRGPLNNFAPGPWEAILDRVYALKQEPGWTPGEKAGYHIGSSWFILGELVRRLDGRAFEDYVREAVFAKADATRSSVGMTEHDIIAAGDALAVITPDFPGNHGQGLTVCRPGANARGPIRELGLVYESLLNHDGRLLLPATSRAMTTRQREGMFDHTFKQTIDWGFGLKLDSKRYGEPETYGYGPHASDATFGHSGNQVGCAFADPKHGLVVAWITNGMPGEEKHQIRQNDLNAAIYEDLQLA